MSVELGPWLRRRRPTRIICQPSGKEWPRPESRPWSQLVDLAGGSESVEAYRDATLLGVWRRPSDPAPAGAPNRGGNVPIAAGAVGAASALGGEFLRAELDGLREIVRMQQAMLREVVASQTLALRSVRASAGVAPVAEEDDEEDDELEGLLRSVLAPTVPGADGMSTKSILASVLQRKAAS